MQNLSGMTQRADGCVDFHGSLAVKASAGILHGAGTSSAPFIESTASKNFLSYYLSSAAASGTTRGMYLRLYLTGGAGGESLRAFTTVSSNTPADTVNGVHSSLNFGSSAGNITGLGTALRATLHVPNRSLGGTTAPLQAEVWGDGSNAALGGLTSFLRLVAAGTPTTIMDANGFLMDIQGLTGGTGSLFRVAAPATLAASLKIRVGSTTYYLPLYSAQA